jgi:hypothetical protein
MTQKVVMVKPTGGQMGSDACAGCGTITTIRKNQRGEPIAPHAFGPQIICPNCMGTKLVGMTVVKKPKQASPQTTLDTTGLALKNGG